MSIKGQHMEIGVRSCQSYQTRNRKRISRENSKKWFSVNFVQIWSATSEDNRFFQIITEDYSVESFACMKGLNLKYLKIITSRLSER